MLKSADFHRRKVVRSWPALGRNMWSVLLICGHDIYAQGINNMPPKTVACMKCPPKRK